MLPQVDAACDTPVERHKAFTCGARTEAKTTEAGVGASRHPPSSAQTTTKIEKHVIRTAREIAFKNKFASPSDFRIFGAVAKGTRRMRYPRS